MTGAERTCPVAGCDTPHPRSFLMCRRHWARVPHILRRALWDAYDRGRGVMSAAYLEARERCIAHVEGREPDAEQWT